LNLFQLFHLTCNCDVTKCQGLLSIGKALSCCVSAFKIVQHDATRAPEAVILTSLREVKRWSRWLIARGTCSIAIQSGWPSTSSLPGACTAQLQLANFRWVPTVPTRLKTELANLKSKLKKHFA
jgi:hypothetical protein